MGSFGHQELPPADSPFLVLTNPTDSERRRTWTQTYDNWGPALTLHDYVEREAYLATVPGAKDGGLTSWILTDSRLPPDERPVLSSCDSYRKHAVVSFPGRGGASAPVRDGVAHCIGSVFTAPEFRGRRYASRMLKELGEVLKSWQAGDFGSREQRTNGASVATKVEDHDQQHPAASFFSVLYSDIGKSFYAKHGWPPYESTHVSWTPTPPGTGHQEQSTGAAADATGIRPLNPAELEELCKVDERLLRTHLPEIAAETNRPAVALVPNLDTMTWHLKREDYMCSHIFPDGRTPSIRGAVFNGSQPGKRLWAIWTRGYYGGLKKREDNTMNILRVVVEDPSATPLDELARVFANIVELARREAGLWEIHDVQLWNPTGVVRTLVEQCGIPCRWVTREDDNIASLRWYGVADTTSGGEAREKGALEVEWVANDKFAWC